MPVSDTAEHHRLNEPHVSGRAPWRRWGCYVGDRAWGTVREDYSADGDAWGFVTHDMARSKAYRWGEDAIAGLCDRYQLLVFAPAFWNGRDPILKERLLRPDVGRGQPRRGRQGVLLLSRQHADAQLHADALQVSAGARIPYRPAARRKPRARTGSGPEFELLDTGVFDEHRYFDIVVEYAKASAGDICIRIEAFNRGPEAAELHVIPQLWFRNTWAWGPAREKTPRIQIGTRPSDAGAFVALEADDTAGRAAREPHIRVPPGSAALATGPPDGEPLFTNNETNGPAAWGPAAVSASAVHERRIPSADRPRRDGRRIPYRDRHQGLPALPRDGAGRRIGRLALSAHARGARLRRSPTSTPSSTRGKRTRTSSTPRSIRRRRRADERLVQRQALAGLLWSKQVYLFDVQQWLEGDDPANPPPASRKTIRNVHWRHLNSMRILSMPDKWEYPWFAAWDLALQLRRAVAGRSGRSPRTISGCCSSNSSSIRTASCPPTNGNSRI